MPKGPHFTNLYFTNLYALVVDLEKKRFVLFSQFPYVFVLGEICEFRTRSFLCVTICGQVAGKPRTTPKQRK